MFYTFRQNNSGGYYDGPAYVCVECTDLLDADDQAERNGITFGMAGSCECCGARWSLAWDEESLTETPSYYGAPLSQLRESWVVFYRDGTKISGG